MNLRSTFAVIALMAGGALAGCSTSEPAGTPIAATQSSTTHRVEVTTPTSTAPANTDAVVCESIERTGKGFYPSYAELMKTEQLNVKPITLSAQLAVLSTTGVPEGSNEIDGTAVITQASPDLRQKTTRMVRDADRLAQHFADVATGAVAGSDVTPIINSFTDVLIACSTAGHTPSWFDPTELTGN